MVWKLSELVARHSEAQTGCPVTYTYSKKGLVHLLGNPFRSEDVFVDHIFPYKISEYTRYSYNKTWYFRIMPQALFRALERRFGWHVCVTAVVD